MHFYLRYLTQFKRIHITILFVLWSVDGCVIEDL